MIRVSLLTLILTAALPAPIVWAAEGPQELELDRSLAQMQAQDTAKPSAAYTASPVAPTLVKPAKQAETPTEGKNERLMDQGLQPESPPDPQGDAVVRRLNGGQ